MKLKLEVQKAGTAHEIDKAFQGFAHQKVKALLVTADPFFNSRRAQVVALAASLSMPAIYQSREFVTAGGLMSYGPSITDAYRQAGVNAGRILNGARPANLPVTMPSRFDLVIDLEKARSFNLKIRPELLASAISPPKERPAADVIVVSTYAGT